jgi:hypothetical protein
MAQGFIADFARSQTVVPTWVEGAPQKSFWTGTKVPRDKCTPVGSFRCATCGYLESYARPEFGRPD